jgi:nucleoside-diphosphate-sugar epimerase
LAARRAQVAVLTRDPAKATRLWPGITITSCVGDLTESRPFTNLCAETNIVFHLAGHAHATDELSGEDQHQRVTVAGTARLLEAARAAGVERFVFVSSVKAMGEATDICLDESAVPAPTTVYGRVRLEAEGLVLAANATGSIATTVLRLPLVYGGQVKGNLMRLIEAIDRGRFPPLPDVQNRRSLVHVDDVVQAMLLAAQSAVASGRVYLVTDGTAYSTRQIYEWISEALGRPVPRWSIPISLLQLAARLGDVMGWICRRRFPIDSGVLEKLTGSACYSSARISAELGYRPRETLSRSIPEMVQAYKSARGV